MSRNASEALAHDLSHRRHGMEAAVLVARHRLEFLFPTQRFLCYFFLFAAMAGPRPPSLSFREANGIISLRITSETRSSTTRETAIDASRLFFYTDRGGGLVAFDVRRHRIMWVARATTFCAVSQGNTLAAMSARVASYGGPYRLALMASHK